MRRHLVTGKAGQFAKDIIPYAAAAGNGVETGAGTVVRGGGCVAYFVGFDTKQRVIKVRGLSDVSEEG